MTHISEELVEKQVQSLKDREEVKAIAVVGSYARDPEADHNDLDILIIVDGNWRKRVTEEVDGVVVEKFFNSVEWFESYIEDETGETDNWYPYYWLKNKNVHYDPENIFEDLKDKVEDQKREYFEEEINEERFLYNIWDMKQDIETDDVGQKRFLMYKLFDYLVDKNYRLKEQIPVKDNYKVNNLQDFDGYMYKLAQDFLNSSSTMEKEKKLDKIIEHVTRGIGDPKPEWETGKEEFNE